jgi:hypothetical protein
MTMIANRLCTLLFLGLLWLPAVAQDAQTPPPAPPAAAEADDDARDAGAAPAPQQAEPPASRPPAPPGDDVFVPTEELAADEEVTFPVDI